MLTAAAFVLVTGLVPVIVIMSLVLAKSPMPVAVVTFTLFKVMPFPPLLFESATPCDPFV